MAICLSRQSPSIGPSPRGPCQTAAFNDVQSPELSVDIANLVPFLFSTHSIGCNNTSLAPTAEEEEEDESRLLFQDYVMDPNIKVAEWLLRAASTSWTSSALSVVKVREEGVIHAIQHQRDGYMSV
ncbi:hypothetical protein HPB50_002333 [Hyalomma asiaticum]|uniref:Uncharacterized protein n=1 Tax=Hyalomma asiaticum TaxID=266040 RepID=A0ACB7RZY0_HYAAI|nr:hypothetical protein HPB50_002333 [Hyalomma asiaticum]